MSDPHTSDERLAADLRLRPERPRVTRLSRRVIAGLGAGVTIVICGAVLWALQSRGPRQESGELYSTHGLDDLQAGMLRSNPLNHQPEWFARKASSYQARWPWLTIEP